MFVESHFQKSSRRLPNSLAEQAAVQVSKQINCSGQARVVLLQPQDSGQNMAHDAGGGLLLEVQRRPVPTKECPPEWPSVCKWVVFSDLHVSPKTLDVCLEVLREVRDAARLRGAGVLFLGDFWHVKGPLAVRPLNAILAELQTWTQPTVMLVGNHDQVLLSGLDHALPPLAAACRSMIMIDQPCIFMDALWLPYRRNVVELQAALKQAGSVTAVFAHADVVGAQWNQHNQAQEGLSPAAFPAGIPTYTGHYHIPHQVPNTNIHYIGSPYQVSMNEAGQSKRLIVLDHDYQQIEEIHLDIGPRHFYIEGAQRAMPRGLRAGDRLKWTVPHSEFAGAKSIAEAYRGQGIEVEVIVAAAQRATRISGCDDLSPQALLDGYAKTVTMSNTALTQHPQLWLTCRLLN